MHINVNCLYFLSAFSRIKKEKLKVENIKRLLDRSTKDNINLRKENEKKQLWDRGDAIKSDFEKNMFWVSFWRLWLFGSIWYVVADCSHFFYWRTKCSKSPWGRQRCINKSKVTFYIYVFCSSPSQPLYKCMEFPNYWPCHRWVEYKRFGLNNTF